MLTDGLNSSDNPGRQPATILLELQRKEKGKGSEEASRETALRAGTQTGKCSKSTSSGKKILGVCHYFQTAKGCSHGDKCRFEHKKLSDKAAKELKSHIDSRREPGRAREGQATRPTTSHLDWWHQ